VIFSSLAKYGHVQRAEKILCLMESYHKDGHTELGPNTIILQAWCTSGQINAATRAEQLLKHMIKLYHAGNQDVRPGCISYSTEISTLASSNDGLAAEKSLDILYEMESKCALGDKDICPSVVTYTAGKTSRRLCSSLLYKLFMPQSFILSSNQCISTITNG
jgi:hypothetical protein